MTVAKSTPKTPETSAEITAKHLRSLLVGLMQTETVYGSYADTTAKIDAAEMLLAHDRGHAEALQTLQDGAVDPRWTLPSRVRAVGIMLRAIGGVA